MPERSLSLVTRFSHLLGNAVVAVVLGGAFAVAFAFVWPIVTGQMGGVDKQLLLSLFSAFFGASMGFLGARVAATLDRVRMRHVKDHNSLVDIQRQLNTVHQLMGEAMFTLSDYGSTVGQTLSVPGALGLYSNWPGFLPELSSETLAGLINVDFFNDVYSTNQQLRRINQDIGNLGRHKNEMQSAALAGQISQVEYKRNLAVLLGQVQTLRAFLGSACAELVERVSAARVLMHEERPTWAFSLRVTPRYYGRNFQKKVGAEREVVIQELKESEERSRRQIAEVVRKIREALGEGHS